jgi:hypothetical protein
VHGSSIEKRNRILLNIIMTAAMFVLPALSVTQWLEGEVLLDERDKIMATVKGACW